MEKCEAAAKDIRGETLNHRVSARHLDLASLKSIREFAAKIIEGRREDAAGLGERGPGWPQVLECGAGVFGQVQISTGEDRTFLYLLTLSRENIFHFNRLHKSKE